MALLVTVSLAGCPKPPDSDTKGPESSKPLAGADINTTDPQWVIQNTPKAKVAVVFIHGIFGDAIDTWTSAPGSSFFKYLNDDPNLGAKLDLFAFGYTSEMLSGGSSFTIQEAANRLHERLKYHGILDYQQIVFVAHSMGGLVTLRELLTHRELLPQVPLIVFYATPQTGAQITTVARYVSANRALEDMLPANKNSFLQALNDEWKEATKNKGPPIICGYEKQTTYGVMVVPWESATRFCSGAALAIDASHITITKPDRPGHDSIVLLVNALNEYVVGAASAAKLELPDFERDGEDWSYTLHMALGQTARIVNAGRLPLRYTIGPPSDPLLLLLPEDTPKVLSGGAVERMRFVLVSGNSQTEYRFKLTSDASDEQRVTVHVPDLPRLQAEQAALMTRMTDDLNGWLTSDDGQKTIKAAGADHEAVRQLFLERARQSVGRELPDTPESLQWVITSDILRTTNWPDLAVEALRKAEQISPPIARVPGVQHIAALSAAASGESRVFATVDVPVQTPAPQGLRTLPADLTASLTGLAATLQTVPALRPTGLSLEGDLQSLSGHTDDARRAYEEAAQARLTPSLSSRLAVLPPAASTIRASPEDSSVIRGADRQRVVNPRIAEDRVIATREPQ